jgi:RimJ/RimL family protein N-acetyltransferase
MLRGELVGLRARMAADTEILHTELYENVEEWARASIQPWIPVPLGDASPYAVRGTDRKEVLAGGTAGFSVVELASGELAGVSSLWGIDTHHRCAHIGIGLRPAFRGRGLGADAVRVMSRYAFVTLGLRRVQLETFSDNRAMIAIAEKIGFTREGTLRSAYWVNGRFADDVVFGLLDTEFSG